MIAGSVAQRPHRGGHAWVFLQYLLGFQRIGWDVLFLDRLTEEMLPGADWEVPVEVRYRPHVEWFLAVMRRARIGDAYSLGLPGGNAVGLDRAEVLRRAREASFLLDINGFLRDDEIGAATQTRVFLDIDPGFNQMWHELGLVNILDGYDAFVTVAQRIGKPDCLIPTCGRSWIATYPPVVLDEWPAQPPMPQAAFTSVATWRGPFAPVEYLGKRYGLRVHEFRPLMALPSLATESFELALEIDSGDEADSRTLGQNGWTLVDPVSASGSLGQYRRYIERSRAEFSVAKAMYVESRSGWFSDRSACYLATGRPVIIQDTGLGGGVPETSGVLLYSSLEGAVEAVERLRADYAQQAAAATDLTCELFDSDKVLRQLLISLGATSLPHE